MDIFENAEVVATKKASTGGKVEVRCQAPGCRKLFMVRRVDQARGWGRFCSKSCKAIEQEGRTGQHARHQRRVDQARSSEHNYLGSGVDRETYLHYQNEYGGIPEFDRNGAYVGFRMSISDLSYGGYNNAGPDDPMGEGKW